MEQASNKRILVAVKPHKKGADAVLAHVRLLAKRLNAEIRLFGCVYDPQVAIGLTSGDSGAVAAQAGMIAGEREELERIARAEREWGERSSVHVGWHAPIYEGIVEEARKWQADLVVAGVHEPGFAPHIFLTDVDWQLIRTCPCPLLIAKNPSVSAYRTVLAAVDPVHRDAEASGVDHAILRTATDLSKAFDAQMLLAHAYPNPEDFALVSAVEVEPGVFYGSENIESLHRGAIEALAGEFDVSAENTILRSGRPRDVIADVVEERSVDLLVVGAVKRSRLEAAVLGSTGEAVAAHTLCDIIFVKPPQMTELLAASSA